MFILTGDGYLLFPLGVYPWYVHFNQWRIFSLLVFYPVKR
jgi:hypothetical protein